MQPTPADEDGVTDVSFADLCFVVEKLNVGRWT